MTNFWLSIRNELEEYNSSSSLFFPTILISPLSTAKIELLSIFDYLLFENSHKLGQVFTIFPPYFNQPSSSKNRIVASHRSSRQSWCTVVKIYRIDTSIVGDHENDKAAAENFSIRHTSNCLSRSSPRRMSKHAEYFNIHNWLAARLLDRGIDARVCMFRMAFEFQGGIVDHRWGLEIRRGDRTFEYVPPRRWAPQTYWDFQLSGHERRGIRVPL